MDHFGTGEAKECYWTRYLHSTYSQTAISCFFVENISFQNSYDSRRKLVSNYLLKFRDGDCIRYFDRVLHTTVRGTDTTTTTTTITTIIPTYSICRVLLEKLTVLQLAKKFPAFHGTRRFVTALTSVRHLSLSWVSPIQSI